MMSVFHTAISIPVDLMAKATGDTCIRRKTRKRKYFATGTADAGEGCERGLPSVILQVHDMKPTI